MVWTSNTFSAVYSYPYTLFHIVDFVNKFSNTYQQIKLPLVLLIN